MHKHPGFRHLVDVHLFLYTGGVHDVIGPAGAVT